MRKWLIPIIAASWSIFQLLLPQCLLLSSEYARAIHLAFALALVFLSFSLKHKRSYDEGEAHRKVPWYDYFLAILAITAALYLIFDYEGIAARQGIPTDRDLFMGVLLITLLLEASRRALGPALPVIALLFILYSFFSEYMPTIISFKNASLGKLISKLTLTTEGVFGVPLDVSSSTIFLFVLFGTMLEKVGGGHYFIQVAYSLLGRFKGGPAKAAVLASGLSGMVSGSGTANVVTTGTFTIPLMKKAGYPAYKAGAIEVAASTNGQLMPPIMGAAAFIIAEYCSLTYFEVVRAAFLPAIVSYLALIYITHLEASKLGLKGMPKSEIPPFWKTFISGIHFLIPLGFLIYQLIIMRRSAGLSAYYAILSLILLTIIENCYLSYQKKESLRISLKKSLHLIGKSLVSGACNMMTIGVAVAAAGIIVGIVTLGLGGVVTEIIDFVSGGNIVIILLVTALLSLLLGMGLPTTANYIVMASLTAPAIYALGHQTGLAIPLIAAHLFCFYFGILADDTPPVGLAAYAASAIAKSNPIKTGLQGFKYDMRTAILPFMFVFNTDLLLIGITSWWGIGVTFISALAAMFAFSSFVQHFFITKNRGYESLILLSSIMILLRPDWFVGNWGLSKLACYAIGISLYFLVFSLQRFRTR